MKGKGNYSIIDIQHPSGHITRAKIDLSEFDNLELAERAAAKMERVNEVLRHVLGQLPKGTKIFLIEKSK